MSIRAPLCARASIHVPLDQKTFWKIVAMRKCYVACAPVWVDVEVFLARRRNGRLVSSRMPQILYRVDLGNPDDVSTLRRANVDSTDPEIRAQVCRELRLGLRTFRARHGRLSNDDPFLPVDIWLLGRCIRDACLNAA